MPKLPKTVKRENSIFRVYKYANCRKNSRRKLKVGYAGARVRSRGCFNIRIEKTRQWWERCCGGESSPNKEITRESTLSRLYFANDFYSSSIMAFCRLTGKERA